MTTIHEAFINAILADAAYGHKLPITVGMQMVAEINQGKHTVMAYLLLPVQKTISEAGHEQRGEKTMIPK